MTQASDGWDASAQAWIVEQGEHGDYGRRHVLDAPMIARLRLLPRATALDVGCGEGRFCRIMRRMGIRTVGLDPGGDYRIGRAETIEAGLGAPFDIVISYLSLIDVPDLAAGLDGMVRALRPGGTLLIANMNPFNTAGMPDGWTRGADGEPRFAIDHYLEERAVWVGWRGIRVVNWHRPLSTYMALLLAHGLDLRYFAEPAPSGGDPAQAERYRRVPYFHIMEWRRPVG